MTAESTRAVLLARAGDARTRLESALVEAGAEVLLAVDPAETDPARIIALEPKVVLVALEPAIEDALEPYEALFADPDITVIYDEADLAAQREGWDAARWTRHLAAKLHRRDDVLPPGGESDDDLHPSPGPLPARAELGELDMTMHAGEALELAAEVPRDDDHLAGRDARDVEFPEADASGSVPGDGHGNAGAADGAADDSTLFSNLSLVDDDPSAAATDAAAEGARGALVIEGGIGGPDAVRQLLGALPKDFPRPVLVRLQLDGGRYDRLVQQMGRASSLPVALAEAGHAVDSGRVFFLAPDVTAVLEQGGLRFAGSDDATASLYGALVADDSAFVLLSGSDLSLVDAVLEQAASGALVAAQPVADCYEAGAAAALVERGGESSPIGDLAQRIAARWPT